MNERVEIAEQAYPRPPTSFPSLAQIKLAAHHSHFHSRFPSHFAPLIRHSSSLSLLAIAAPLLLQRLPVPQNHLYHRHHNHHHHHHHHRHLYSNTSLHSQRKMCISPKGGSPAPAAETPLSTTMANPTASTTGLREGDCVDGESPDFPPPASDSSSNPTAKISVSLAGAAGAGGGSGSPAGGSGGTGNRGRGLRKSPIRGYPHHALCSPAPPNVVTHHCSAVVDNSSSTRDGGILPYSREQQVNHHQYQKQPQYVSLSSSVPRHIKDRIQEGKYRTRGSVGILPTISEHGRESPANSNRKSSSNGSRQNTSGPGVLAVAAGNLVCAPLAQYLRVAPVCMC